MSIKRRCLSLAGLVLILAAGCAPVGDDSPDVGKQGPLVGEAAPEIVGQNSRGETMKLSDFKGKVVMLDFWATWCGPCRSMFPHEKQLVSRHQDQPFALLGVSADSDVNALRKMEDRDGLTWSSWWDGSSGPIARRYRVNAFPTILLIDHEGIVRYRFEGVPSAKTLDNAIDGLVKAAKGKTQGS